jgi:hypothetical protein
MPLTSGPHRSAEKHHRDRGCDYTFWTKCESWPLAQAPFILLGKEPPPLEILAEGTWDEPADLRKIQSLIVNGVENGLLRIHWVAGRGQQVRHLRVADLLKWVRDKQILQLPQELAAFLARPLTPNQLPPEGYELWRQRDLWTLRETCFLLLGWEPDESAPNCDARNKVREDVCRAIVAEALPVVGTSTPAELLYNGQKLRPEDVIRWAGSRFPAFPFKRAHLEARELLFELLLPAGTKTVSVGEALNLTSAAVWPDIASEDGEQVVVGLRKQMHRDRRPVDLTDEDLADLRAVLQGADLKPLAFPMGIPTFRQYEEACQGSALGWRLVPILRDPAHERRIRRAVTRQEHEAELSKAIESGSLRPLSPVTLLPLNASTPTARDQALLTLEQLTRFCGTLGIRVLRSSNGPTTARAAPKPSRQAQRDDAIRTKYEELAQAGKRNYIKEIQRSVPGAESLSDRRIRDIVKGR